MAKFKPNDLVIDGVGNVALIKAVFDDKSMYRIEIVKLGSHHALSLGYIADISFKGIDSTCELFTEALSDQSPSECRHQWTEYVGFREAYCFCAKCDIRKAA